MNPYNSSHRLICKDCYLAVNQCRCPWNYNKYTFKEKLRHFYNKFIDTIFYYGCCLYRKKSF